MSTNDPLLTVLRGLHQSSVHLTNGENDRARESLADVDRILTSQEQMHLLIQKPEGSQQ